MPARPLNDKSVQSGGSASEPRLTLHVKTEAGKSGKIRIIANLHRDNGNPYDVGEGHYDMLIIHRTILKHIQDEVKQNHDSAFEFLRDIKSVIPFVVLDSGGGYPDEIRDHYKGTFKFLPFSFVSEHLLQKRIAKVGLSQLLMGLTDAKQHD